MSVILWDKPQEYIILNGKRSPGFAEVSGAKAVYDYHVHEHPFSTGARMLFKRRAPAKFNVRIHLFTREDIEAFDLWRAVIDRTPDARRAANALYIAHPQLAALGITECVVLSVSQLEHDTFGGYYVEIEFSEFQGFPEPSQAKVDSAPVADVDPVDAEIITKTSQLSQTLEALSE